MRIGIDGPVAEVREPTVGILAIDIDVVPSAMGSVGTGEGYECHTVVKTAFIMQHIYVGVVAKTRIVPHSIRPRAIPSRKADSNEARQGVRHVVSVVVSIDGILDEAGVGVTEVNAGQRIDQIHLEVHLAVQLIHEVCGQSRWDSASEGTIGYIICFNGAILVAYRDLQIV